MRRSRGTYKNRIVEKERVDSLRDPFFLAIDGETLSKSDMILAS
ncbi:MULTISPECIES: hypothetical protein [unclassified Bacillus cereus group]|nr:MULTISPECIES: hypothetical protein [unclassified Bacillus cereus group]MDA2146965.1 hypothetical protein [Bacillus cereus group sp. Bc248]MDA2174864.1 hypothetical protein [Bacillus cereus group sp. Bc247]